MKFYHPELLYGLLTLIIPIIVHLFQLRRFKTEYFSNVALLQKLVISSRKSSRIKKWLSLFTRLLIITCLVLAFAQPYFPNSNNKSDEKQISIFLDNSSSMSLQGEYTSIFNQAKEELFEVIPEEEIYQLATHNETYKNLKAEDLKNIVYDLNYTSNAINISSILAKTERLFDKSKSNTENELIILSDFQDLDNNDSLNFKKQFNYHLVKYQPQDLLNFSIDTAYIETSKGENILQFKVSSSEAISQNLPVSISNKDKMIGKFSLNFENETSKSFSFSLDNDEILNGIIKIEDNGLQYDNSLYFTLKKPELINILVISEKRANYLDKIFNDARFEYNQKLIGELEFSEVNSNDVLIINELKSFPNTLQIVIDNFVELSKPIIIIPHQNINSTSYNALFKKIGLSDYTNQIKNNIRLTNINFDHPVFESVFTESIQNFDYPSFESYFESKNPEKALSFSNNRAFLESRDKIFRFNAPITENSNFAQSPLVVLSFYNIALLSQSQPDIYLENSKTFSLKNNQNQGQDEVFSLINNDEQSIPRQETKGTETKFYLKDYPTSGGHYYVLNSKKDTITTIAFNEKRIESRLQYLDLSDYDQVITYNNFSEFTDFFYESYKIQSLWRWFVILALIFMIIELLLLKFIK